MWQRVVRGAGRFEVRNLIGHGFCYILFELALSLVSKRTSLLRRGFLESLGRGKLN